MNKKGLFLVFLTAFISGVSIFLNKFSVSKIDPYIFTFLKNVFVTVFLFSIIILFKNFKEIKRLNWKKWLNLVLIGLIGGSVPFLLFFKGLQMSSSVLGAFIHKTMFIYVGVLATIFLKEKLNKKIFISAMCLLIGNLLLLNFNKISFNYGDLLILIATLFWAGENTLSKYVLRDLSGNVVGFGRMFFGSIFILLFLFFTKKVELINTITINQLFWILFTSILLSGYVLTWYNGIKHVKITVATSILLLGSPITMILNYVFFNDVINLFQLIGIVIILFGVFSVVLFTQRITVFHRHSRSEL